MAGLFFILPILSGTHALTALNQHKRNYKFKKCVYPEVFRFFDNRTSKWEIAIMRLDRNCHCICLKKTTRHLNCSQLTLCDKAPFGHKKRRDRKAFCVFRQYSQVWLCVAKQGGRKKKRRQWKRRGPGSFRLPPSTYRLVGCVWGFVAPLAIQNDAQGLTGGHRPWQTMCVYKPDARKRRRSERGKRVRGRGRGVSQQPHTLCSNKNVASRDCGCSDLFRHFLERA